MQRKAILHTHIYPQTQSESVGNLKLPPTTPFWLVMRNVFCFSFVSFPRHFLFFFFSFFVPSRRRNGVCLFSGLRILLDNTSFGLSSGHIRSFLGRSLNNIVSFIGQPFFESFFIIFLSFIIIFF